MRLNEYIDAVLLEAAKDRYWQMLQGLPEETHDKARDAMQWAMKTLLREDRIVWYLRFIRIEFLERWLVDTKKQNQDEPVVERYKKIAAKFKNEIVRKGGMPLGSVESAVSNLAYTTARTRLEHFGSMFAQVPAMDAVVFDYQNPSQLFNDLNRIEKEWAEARDDDKRALPATDDFDGYEDAEKIIDFSDGFVWWNLGVSSCKAEGDAMGHCGNTADDRGTVLSLRKRIMRGDEPRDIPYLTFILDDAGELGEMKGRANNKPAERYHPYIIALLRHPIIKGIKGGGYAPGNNFSLNDLDDEVREQLLAEKPALAGLRDLYAKEGLSDKFMNRLYDKLHDNNIDASDLAVGPPRRGEQETIIVAKFRIDDMHNDELRAAEMLIDRETFAAGIKSEDMALALDRLEDADLVALAEWLGMPGLGRQVGSNRIGAISTLSMQLSDSAGRELVQTAAKNLAEVGQVTLTKDEIHEYMKVVALHAFEHAPYYGDVVFGEVKEGGDVLSATNIVTVTPDEIIDMIESIDDDYYEGDGLNAHDIRHYGWVHGSMHNDWADNIDDDVFERVNPTIRKIIKNKFNDDVDLELLLDDPDEQRRFGEALIDAMRGTRREPRPDKDQMGDLFDHEIRRMKALAGLLRG